MSDELKDDKLYGQGHNYQKKYGFPKGMLDCFEPPAASEAEMSPEAMAAYKSTAAGEERNSGHREKRKDY